MQGFQNLRRMDVYTDADIERFWARVDKRGPDECWEWQGSYHHKGYGYFSIKHRVIYAHRFSYTIHFEPLPNGVLVCHSCDDGRCVNPKHLFMGTPQDNTDDMISKNRINRDGGEKRPNAIFTNREVSILRALFSQWGGSMRRFCKEHTINYETARTALNNLSYKDAAIDLDTWL